MRSVAEDLTGWQVDAMVSLAEVFPTVISHLFQQPRNQDNSGPADVTSELL